MSGLKYQSNNWVMVSLDDGANVDYFDTKEAAAAALVTLDSSDVVVFGYDDKGTVGPVLQLEQFGSRKHISEISLMKRMLRAN